MSKSMAHNRVGSAKTVRGVAAFFAAALFLLTHQVRAETERINHYHSDIEVQKDGSLAVTETIQVTAAGRKIKRGIYRDFPTRYKKNWFLHVELPFAVVSVTRDGKPEPFHIQNQSNGVRLYIGSKQVFVSPGKHTYEIRYTTNYQLGYFDSHDELYWNVTGNGWEFAIEQVSADVTLPAEAPLAKVTHESYTGREGAQGRNASSTANQTTGQVNFQATQPLLPHEGLTIVVGFPKGLVRVPAATGRGALYLRGNVTLWVVLGGLLTVLLYYITAWSLVGRDPIGDVIVPRFESPLDLSPACIRYLWRMDYDRTCFTVAVLNMAAKGRLAIKEQDSTFSLSRPYSAAQQKLADGEQAVMKKLLPKGDARSIVLMQANHKKIKKSIEALSDCLAREFDGKLFLKHRKWLVIGWLLSALFVVAGSLSSQDRSESMQGLVNSRGLPDNWWGNLILVGSTFLSCCCCPATGMCVWLAKAVPSAWRSARTLRRNTQKRLGSYGGAIGLTALAIPFFIGELGMIYFMVLLTSFWMLPLLVGLVAINWIFWRLIKQPTIEGKRIMDEIEGFRMYLGAVEGESLRQLHPPEQTPELFEKYLPYALALGVEHAWADRFTDVLNRAATEPGDTQGYRPSWYRGREWQATAAGDFASNLGSSLGGAIASSSTAPGSSSGSSGGGGGGSSGGGGGGGGGGGW